MVRREGCRGRPSLSSLPYSLASLWLLEAPSLLAVHHGPEGREPESVGKARQTLDRRWTSSLPRRRVTAAAPGSQAPTVTRLRPHSYYGVGLEASQVGLSLSGGLEGVSGGGTVT